MPGFRRGEMLMQMLCLGGMRRDRCIAGGDFGMKCSALLRVPGFRRGEMLAQMLRLGGMRRNRCIAGVDFGMKRSTLLRVPGFRRGEMPAQTLCLGNMRRDRRIAGGDFGLESGNPLCQPAIGIASIGALYLRQSRDKGSVALRQVGMKCSQLTGMIPGGVIKGPL